MTTKNPTRRPRPAQRKPYGSKRRAPVRKSSTHTDAVRIIPLGGLGEVGRNMTLVEYGKEILILDIGINFPEEDMPGIDYTIPDISYLEEAKRNGKRIVGILFTHGHYDHIAAVPYVLPKIGFDIPMFASDLTKGIILKRQTDFPQHPKLKIRTIKSGDELKLGPFGVEIFRVTHSVPGSLGFFIKSPIGNIIHVADFKFDENPVNDLPTDIAKFKSFAKRDPLLLTLDSTGAELEGHSLSEEHIFENLDEIFKECKGRVFTGTFASLLNRVQQIITLSEKYGRKVAVEGYSMKSNVEISRRLGYLKYKKGTIISAREINKLPDNKVTVVSTGAQGESRAALMRIASGMHRNFKLHEGDTVIFSSSIVPGNERSVQQLKDKLYRQNVNVLDYRMLDIHTGGHAKRDEMRQMIEMVKPKYFLPLHGQYSMLVNNARIAEETGVPKANTFVMDNGQILSLTKTKATILEETAPSEVVMVDGLGVGDIGEVVLRDRKTLSNDGMFVIVAAVDKKTGKVKGSPDIISRGFVYLRESKGLLQETRKKTTEIINKSSKQGGAVNWTNVKDDLKSKIGSYLFTKTERRPMVLPVIIEV